jgi:hypothetical protein
VDQVWCPDRTVSLPPRNQTSCKSKLVAIFNLYVDGSSTNESSSIIIERDLKIIPADDFAIGDHLRMP